ncbi:cell division protein ZapB [Geoalkalibacter sp.]|uniref:cell division protein ZapB n=1 Tax=Geoalkalibacter sp. TaxID=3041440 RepID=UPI00272DE61C|nr:cell division protein ZapB [Geoalkalibacter sp.]
MDLRIILRLEEKIDQLLSRNQDLEEQVRQFAIERSSREEELERIRQELDRILAKLDFLDREMP